MAIRSGNTHDFSERRHQSPDAQGWRWWKEDDPSSVIVPHVRDLEMRQTWKRLERLVFAKLYTEQNVADLNQIGSSTQVGDGRSTGERMSWNVVQMAVNTAWPRITRSPPRVRFLTNGGNHTQQTQARGLTQWCDGMFYKTGMWRKLGPLVARDAMIFGSGTFRFHERDKEIVPERTLIDDLLFDENEAISGKPRTLYQRWFVHRDVLKALYGGKRSAEGERIDLAIDAAKGWRPAMDYVGGESNIILAYEAWHLPSKKGADDGAYAVAIDGATLERRDRDKPYFPFAFMHWEPPVRGMWGRGLPELQMGVQYEINESLRAIQQTHRRVSRARVFMDSGALLRTKLNNEIGTIYEKKPGSQIIFDPGVGVVPDMYQHLLTNFAKGLELAGVSMTAATAMKPAGLNSAPAQREYADQSDARQLKPAEAYEQLFVDSAEIMIDMAADLAKRGIDVAVNAPMSSSVRKVKFSEVNLDRDAYIMQAYPTSIMPILPAARFEWIEERVKAGWMTREEAMMLSDFPDLESVSSIQNAAMRTLQMVIEKILDEGEFTSPEPSMNPAYAVTHVPAAALKARMDGVAEDRIDLLYRFAAECAEILEPGVQAVPPAAVPPVMPAQPVDMLSQSAASLPPSAAAQPPMLPAGMPPVA